jgi:hypothetical protein
VRCYTPVSVSSGPHHGGSTLALSRIREDAEDAEVIDLVQLPRGTRPTPIAYLDIEEVDRCRVIDCGHYQSCLNFAARVQWRSFHCRQCPHHPEREAADTARSVDGHGPEAAIIRFR